MFHPYVTFIIFYVLICNVIVREKCGFLSWFYLLHLTYLRKLQCNLPFFSFVCFEKIWTVQKFFASGHTNAVEAMIKSREELFTIIKSLSAFTKSNIVVENYKGVDSAVFIEREPIYQSSRPHAHPDLDSRVFFESYEPLQRMEGDAVRRRGCSCMCSFNQRATVEPP